MQLGWAADAIDLNIQVRNGCIVGSIRLEAIDDADDDYKTSTKENSPFETSKKDHDGMKIQTQ